MSRANSAEGSQQCGRLVQVAAKSLQFVVARGCSIVCSTGDAIVPVEVAGGDHLGRDADGERHEEYRHRNPCRGHGCPKGLVRFEVYSEVQRGRVRKLKIRAANHVLDSPHQIRFDNGFRSTVARPAQVRAAMKTQATEPVRRIRPTADMPLPSSNCSSTIIKEPTMPDGRQDHAKTASQDRRPRTRAAFARC